MPAPALEWGMYSVGAGTPLFGIASFPHRAMAGSYCGVCNTTGRRSPRPGLSVNPGCVVHANRKLDKRGEFHCHPCCHFRIAIGNQPSYDDFDEHSCGTYIKSNHVAGCGNIVIGDHDPIAPPLGHFPCVPSDAR